MSSVVGPPPGLELDEGPPAPAPTAAPVPGKPSQTPLKPGAVLSVAAENFGSGGPAASPKSKARPKSRPAPGSQAAATGAPRGKSTGPKGTNGGKGGPKGGYLAEPRGSSQGRHLNAAAAARRNAESTSRRGYAAGAGQNPSSPQQWLPGMMDGSPMGPGPGPGFSPMQPSYGGPQSGYGGGPPGMQSHPQMNPYSQNHQMNPYSQHSPMHVGQWAMHGPVPPWPGGRPYADRQSPPYQAPLREVASRSAAATALEKFAATEIQREGKVMAQEIDETEFMRRHLTAESLAFATARRLEKKQKQEEAGGEGPSSQMRFYGKVKKYNAGSGFGFIFSEALWNQYGCDVFLNHAVEGGVVIGSIVSFTVVLGPTGQPQARNILLEAEADPNVKETPYTKLANSGTILRGRVKSYSAHRGFGFLRCPDTHEELAGVDIYIGNMQVPPQGLHPGEEVDFRLGVDKKGNPRALELKHVQLQPAEAG